MERKRESDCVSFPRTVLSFFFCFFPAAVSVGKGEGFVDPRRQSDRGGEQARDERSSKRRRRLALCPTRWIVTRVRIPAEAARGPLPRAELCRWSNK